MARTNINDLAAFVAVARERSFTRAAAKLGVSQSALSHTLRGLEARLGVRLLTRTTRSVTPTEAGERLLGSIGPRLDEIEAELAALSELRDRPAGNIRITADEFAVSTTLQPALSRLLPDYPDIRVEVVIDYTLTDIAAERFDAGVRLGDLVDKDMISVPIGPPMRMLAVASPTYFAKRPAPNTPEELTGHNCINLRLPTLGGLYAWEFERGGREFRVRVDGQLTFNSIVPIAAAAVDGLGIAYLPEPAVTGELARGELVSALEAWSPPFEGHHIYYPSRRQPTPAFALLVEALRYRPER